jgi:hypothetical protein
MSSHLCFLKELVCAIFFKISSLKEKSNQFESIHKFVYKLCAGDVNVSSSTYGLLDLGASGKLQMAECPNDVLNQLSSTPIAQGYTFLSVPCIESISACETSETSVDGYGTPSEGCVTNRPLFEPLMCSNPVVCPFDPPRITPIQCPAAATGATTSIG